MLRRMRSRSGWTQAGAFIDSRFLPTSFQRPSRNLMSAVSFSEGSFSATVRTMKPVPGGR